MITRRVDLHLALLGATLVACAFAFAAFGTPTLPPAPMVMLGVPSPLTGMTRSFVALAQGHVVDALVLHPLGPLCFGACVLAMVSFATTLHTGRRPAAIERVLRMRHGAPIVAALFAAVWARQIVVYG